MKKNKIIILGIIVTIITIIIFVILLVKDNTKSNNQEKENMNQESVPQQTLKEFIESEEGHDLSITLSNYGYEIFKEKKYLNYQKTEEGIYYLTKRELSDLGYDLSKLDQNCSEEEIIMFIQADENGNSLNGKDLPVVYKMSCTLE